MYVSLSYNIHVHISALLISLVISNRGRLKLGDAFVGYQEDTPAAVVFQAYHHIKALKQWEREDKIETSEEQKDQVTLQQNTYNCDNASDPTRQNGSFLLVYH